MPGGGSLLYPVSYLDPLLTLPTDELSSLSLGSDRIFDGVSTNFWLMFSVDRSSVGIPGGPVNTQATGNGAAGDIFWLENALGAPVLYKDAIANGLTPLPPGPQTNLDALAMFAHFEYAGLLLFTLDSPTAAKLGYGPADILCQSHPGPGCPPAVLYASAAVLGLNGADHIDGLAVKDKGTRTVLDAADTVLVSLVAGDPTLVAQGWSGADIIRVYPGPLAVVRTAAQLGLSPTDEVDAISAYCCDKAGDANEDGLTNVGDAIFMINYVFKGGPRPRCPDKGDVNSDGKLNVGEAVYLIGYIFKAGSAPVCGHVY